MKQERQRCPRITLELTTRFLIVCQVMTGFAWGTATAFAISEKEHPAKAEPDYTLFNVQESDAAPPTRVETVGAEDSLAIANQPADWLIAAPENLNPGLYVPPPQPPEPPAVDAVPDPIESDEPSVPQWQIENLTVDFSDAFTNFGQGNQFIEPEISGVLPNGDRVSIMPGFNTFTQPDVNSVVNIPIKLAWTREMGDFTTTVGGGIDLFDQLPVALNFEANTSVPLGQQAVLSFFVEQGPYKFNATTLNNQITTWRYGPNLFWQIAEDTSFFSLVRWGRYNDGNREQQSFSRLEHRIGDVSIATNVFNWRYRQDAEATSGYFSPPDFLVVNGELAWEGEVFDWLDCRLSTSWGRQRLIGAWSSAYGYGAQCTFQVTDSIEVDLGYGFDNVIGQTGGSAFNNRAISSQVRANF